MYRALPCMSSHHFPQNLSTISIIKTLRTENLRRAKCKNKFILQLLQNINLSILYTRCRCSLMFERKFWRLRDWLHLMFSSKIINFGYLLDLLFSAFTILFTFVWYWLDNFAFGPYDEQSGNISCYGSHFKDGDPPSLGDTCEPDWCWYYEGMIITVHVVTSEFVF